ncbi:MAG: hypothetical protein F6J92_33775 [Symploca sp. SIO1A3]|nr:hypothetical protein [Symploca sp. SIO1A3]
MSQNRPPPQETHHEPDDNFPQPRANDAVLGGGAPPLVNNVVLGGVEGVKSLSYRDPQPTYSTILGVPRQ